MSFSLSRVSLRLEALPEKPPLVHGTVIYRLCLGLMYVKGKEKPFHCCMKLDPKKCLSFSGSWAWEKLMPQACLICCLRACAPLNFMWSCVKNRWYDYAFHEHKHSECVQIIPEANIVVSVAKQAASLAQAVQQNKVTIRIPLSSTIT
jgi:hypothetical protein